MSTAQLLNQQGNYFFRTGDLERAERCYRAARENVAVADPRSASLAVDILKGLGDVHLCLDRRTEAASVLQEIFSLIAENSLSSFGRTPEAKALQYAGDVARRRAVTGPSAAGPSPAGRTDGRKVHEARYWYERAQDLYSAQDLELGRLITGYKTMELLALQGDAATALIGHTEIADQFASLGNTHWSFRSAVAILKVSTDAGFPPDAPLIDRYRQDLVRLSGRQPSPVDDLWRRMALAVVSPDRRDATEECRVLADRIGLRAMAAALEHDLPGPWMYAYS